MVAVGGQHQLLLYHSGTLELLGVLPFPEGNPGCVQFSRDGRLLVVGWGRGAKFGFADVYDVATGERAARVGNEYDTVLAADLNSDQTEVALGGPSKHVKVFSTRDGRLLHDLKKHTDWVTAIQYSPDSVLLATGDRNGGLVVWEADSGQELYTLTGHQASINSVNGTSPGSGVPVMPASSFFPHPTATRTAVTAASAIRRMPDSLNVSPHRGRRDGLRGSVVGLSVGSVADASKKRAGPPLI